MEVEKREGRGLGMLEGSRRRTPELGQAAEHERPWEGR